MTDRDPTGRCVIESDATQFLETATNYRPQSRLPATSRKPIFCKLLHDIRHLQWVLHNQPALPEATWKAEAEKMIHVYKAPVDEKDVPAIVDYLTKIKGAK
jgi:hypothetical protein